MTNRRGRRRKRLKRQRSRRNDCKSELYCLEGCISKGELYVSLLFDISRA